MEILDLFQSLHQADVRYMLCGGLAVNIYGIPRATADVDIVLDFEAENIRTFLRTVHSLAFESSLPIRLEELVDASTRQRYFYEKNLIAYSFFNSRNNLFLLDVLVQVPIPFAELWAERETRFSGDVPITLVSPAHLIRMKEVTTRVQDAEDVLLLSRLINKEAR